MYKWKESTEINFASSCAVKHPINLMYSLKFGESKAPKKCSWNCLSTVAKSSFYEGQRKPSLLYKTVSYILH